MTASTPHQGLESFYKFFENYGAERLKGLDESYFAGISESEKQEAWDFLKDGYSLSSERIDALYLLNKSRAVNLFKEALGSPLLSSQFAAEREAMERNRLLLLKYVNSVEPDEKYIDAMSKFASSEFARIRAEFAQSLPVRQVTHNALSAIKGMIFTETERIPLASAIDKLMAIHQMSFDAEDPLYKSIYLSLRSDDQEEKIAGMKRLEMLKPLGEP